MAWFDEPSPKSEYRFLFSIIRISSGVWGHMNGYTYCARGPMLEQRKGILRHFLKELDSGEALVQMQKPDDFTSHTPACEMTYGGSTHSSEQITFSALEEDLPNLCTDKPVHFACYTEIGLDNKEEFLSVINLFL